MAGKGNLANPDATPTTIRPTAFSTMLRAMANDAASEESAFTGDDLTAILEAETEADIWEADERPPLNFQHLVGCTLEIIDFEVRYSRGNNAGIDTVFTYEGKNMYLLVKCVRLAGGEKSIYRLPEIGQEFTANTSARFVVTKLWAFLLKGLIDPKSGRTLTTIVQGTDLGEGQQVIKLRPAPNQGTLIGETV